MRQSPTRETVAKIADQYGARISTRRLYGCRAYVQKYDAEYLILVDDTLSNEAQALAILHELLHIELGHLDDDTKTADEKEQEVRRLMKK